MDATIGEGKDGRGNGESQCRARRSGPRKVGGALLRREEPVSVVEPKANFVCKGPGQREIDGNVERDTATHVRFVGLVCAFWTTILLETKYLRSNDASHRDSHPRGFTAVDRTERARKEES